MESSDAAGSPPDSCMQPDALKNLGRSQSLPANLAMQFSQLGSTAMPVACAVGPAGAHSSASPSGMKTQVLSVLGQLLE